MEGRGEKSLVNYKPRSKIYYLSNLRTLMRLTLPPYNLLMKKKIKIIYSSKDTIKRLGGEEFYYITIPGRKNKKPNEKS